MSYSKDSANGLPSFVSSDNDEFVSLVSTEDSQLETNRLKGIKTPGWTFHREIVKSNGSSKYLTETLIAFSGAGTMIDRVDIPIVNSLRSASIPTDWIVGSGHSLVDPFINGGGMDEIYNAHFGNADYTYQRTFNQSTIPGSSLSFRWENRTDRYEQLDARHHIDQFQTLITTEGGPPAHIGPGLNGTLTYLMNFVENSYRFGNGGNGAETVVWSIWPNAEGWVGFGGNEEANWGRFGGFRGALEEYGRIFRYMSEYATWKMRQLHPELSNNYRVWMFPGHAWWARIYDDIQLGLVPGITDHHQLFGDDIHANQIGKWGISVFVYTCAYQVDTRDINVNVPSRFLPRTEETSPGVFEDIPGVTPELDEYFRRVAWEIANSEESVGMGGTVNATPTFNPADGDPLPNWVFPGDPPIVIPTDPNDDDENWTPPQNAVTAFWTAADGYSGPALASDVGPGDMPTVEDGILHFPGLPMHTEQFPIEDELYFCLSLKEDGHVAYTSDQPHNYFVGNVFDVFVDWNRVQFIRRSPGMDSVELEISHHYNGQWTSLEVCVTPTSMHGYLNGVAFEFENTMPLVPTNNLTFLGSTWNSTRPVSYFMAKNYIPSGSQRAAYRAAMNAATPTA